MYHILLMKNHLLVKVFLAIILAIIVGRITGANEIALKTYSLIGQLFLNALTLVVVPLVASSIITGAARMGAEENFESLGLKTVGYFVLNTFTAALLGVILVMVISPGTIAPIDTSLVNSSQVLEIEKNATGDPFDQFANILLRMVPSNILLVASQNQMLGLIFFSLTFGFFISKIESTSGTIVLGFFKGIFQIMMQITHLVMKALPIGVFGLVAKIAATTGPEALKSLGWFFLVVLLGLFAHALMTLPVLLKIIGRVSPVRHFKAMWPAILTALSTSSSAATLPLTIECVEKRANVSNRICSFTVPLGTSLNMAGTAVYAAVTTIFIAQAYGITLSLSTQMIILVMSFITSFGVAGVPSASLVSIVMILHTVGLPADGIGLVMAVDRIVDMFRTTVNVFGNSCCAVLIARSEGENGILAK